MFDLQYQLNNSQHHIERAHCLSHLPVPGPLYDVNSQPNGVHGCTDLPEPSLELGIYYPAQRCSENSVAKPHPFIWWCTPDIANLLHSCRASLQQNLEWTRRGRIWEMTENRWMISVGRGLRSCGSSLSPLLKVGLPGRLSTFLDQCLKPSNSIRMKSIRRKTLCPGNSDIQSHYKRENGRK